MKKLVAIAAVLTVAWCCFYLYQLSRSLRQASAISTQSLLMFSYAELKEHGAFTNPAPDRCRIYLFTNAYAISGTHYHCALAADSWDYHDNSNVLAITASGVFLFIDQQGAVPCRGIRLPSGR